jgi:hypothetical protein
MSVYVGKRKGIRVCTDVTPPVFPSRTCRLLGHCWDTSRWSYQGNPEWSKCNRCGAEESWYDHDSDRGREALEQVQT